MLFFPIYIQVLLTNRMLEYPLHTVSFQYMPTDLKLKFFPTLLFFLHLAVFPYECIFISPSFLAWSSVASFNFVTPGDSAGEDSESLEVRALPPHGLSVRGASVQRFPRWKVFHFSSLCPVHKSTCINLSWCIL